MKLKQKILLSIALVLSVSVGSIYIESSYVGATSSCGGVNTSIINCDQTGNGTCPDGTIVTAAQIESGTKCCPTGTLTADQIKNGTKCTNGSKVTNPTDPVVGIDDNGLWGLLIFVINILSAGVGILAVGGLVYASIMYSAAGGNPEASKKAKIMITNTIVGLIAYALMFALLNFIVPGGLFTT